MNLRQNLKSGVVVIHAGSAPLSRSHSFLTNPLYLLC